MSHTTELSGYPPRRADAGRATPGRAALRTVSLTALGAALRAMRRALGWPGRVYRARQLMHELAGLGDHALRDIGLTRLDLHAASALPFDADPSLLLRRRAEERRRRR